MRIAGIILLALSCAGCASATRGWNEQIAISSTPAGATATVAGGDTPIECVTPCAIQVKRSADIVVTFNKQGYQPEIVPLTKELATTGAAGFAGNLLLGGVVGMAVDGASSAAMDHKPNPVIVTLKPLSAQPRRGPRPLNTKPEAPPGS